MKKSSMVLLALAVGGAFLAALFFAALGDKGKASVMTSTEAAPIYNHFPDFPETSEMKWCSKSSGGVGLVTTTLYIFAFYDKDVSSQLGEMEIEDEAAKIALYYAPDEVKGQKWRHVKNAAFAFQTGIKDTRKMCTEVYINEAGTILYVEAMGD
ncbi:MAG: hypothetical protein HFH77_13895 [Lachnospiraceae bacterium]|jgi:hypothetical protein|nr:hypothetical protein [Lachnospiraceae bacterium]